MDHPLLDKLVKGGHARIGLQKLKPGALTVETYRTPEAKVKSYEVSVESVKHKKMLMSGVIVLIANLLCRDAWGGLVKHTFICLVLQFQRQAALNDSNCSEKTYLIWQQRSIVFVTVWYKGIKKKSTSSVPLPWIPDC